MMQCLKQYLFSSLNGTGHLERRKRPRYTLQRRATSRRIRESESSDFLCEAENGRRGSLKMLTRRCLLSDLIAGDATT